MDLLGFLCLLIGVVGMSIRISRLEGHAPVTYDWGSGKTAGEMVLLGLGALVSLAVLAAALVAGPHYLPRTVAPTSNPDTLGPVFALVGIAIVVLALVKLLLLMTIAALKGATKFRNSRALSRIR